MIALLISILVLAVSLLIISKIPPVGVEIDNPVKALIVGAIIGVFNGIWQFLPSALTKTVSILSLGIIPLIGSIIVFGLAAWLVEGFRLRWGLWSAILGAILLTIISSILNWILTSVGIFTTAI
ncbi:MAG: phage holin family protein [Nodosilinea sp.]|jgi:putative membrane protein